MRRDGFHRHPCRHKAAGCKGTYSCSDDYLERNTDPSGVICSVDPLSEGECEDCTLSRCSMCGAVLTVEAHEDECEKATAV